MFTPAFLSFFNVYGVYTCPMTDDAVSGFKDLSLGETEADRCGGPRTAVGTQLGEPS